MGWANLDDGFYSNSKIMDLLLDENVDGPRAIGIWTLALSWAHRHTLDKPEPELGVIPASLIKGWDRMFGATKDAETLADARLWDRLPGGSYRIHDFREWCQLDVRDAKRRGGRKGADRRWHGTPMLDANGIPTVDANGTPTEPVNGYPMGDPSGVPVGGSEVDPITPTPPHPTPNTPCASADAEARFDEFWAVYPPGRKKAKVAARAAWVKAVTGAKPHREPTPPQVIIDGAVAYSESRDVQRGYAAMPTTWLNQGRWDAEPDEDPATERFIR